MSVISVRETFDGRDGQLVGPIASLYKNRQWKITTDGSGDTAETIYAQCRPGGTGGGSGTSGTLPGLFGTHPDNVFYTCRSLVIEPFAQKFAWLAKANYSTAPLGKEEKEQQERETYPNPSDRPPKIRKTSTPTQVYRLRTRSGVPLLNSAGDPFPPQAKSISLSSYRIEMNVPTWLDAWDLMSDTVNENEYTITDGVKTIVIPPLRGLVTSLEVSELKEENEYTFYTITGVIHRGLNDLHWQLSLLDEGFHFIDSGIRKRILIKDAEDNDIEPAESQLLNKAGGVLAVGAEPAYIDFEDWNEVRSWADLPFGTET